MSGVPPDVARRLAERDAARAAGDYATADDLRERIRAAGYDVLDEPDGSRAVEMAPVPGVAAEPRTRRVEDVASLLGEPARRDVSLHWLADRAPADVLRGIASFERTAAVGMRVGHVVVDALEDEKAFEWSASADAVHVDPAMGWARARNAGLRRADGEVVVVVDGSVEATGDALTPLVEALRDPSVGVCGPFGLITRDLRTFEPSDGPDVDAIEAYLMAFRRSLLLDGLAFEPGFRWYRSADLELSFQVKSRGLRATVVDAPVVRHEHRAWAAASEAERERLSKRNFYRFLDRWRGRTDLLVSGEGEPPPS